MYKVCEGTHSSGVSVLPEDSFPGELSCGAFPPSSPFPLLDLALKTEGKKNDQEITCHQIHSWALLPSVTCQIKDLRRLPHENYNAFSFWQMGCYHQSRQKGSHCLVIGVLQAVVLELYCLGCLSHCGLSQESLELLGESQKESQKETWPSPIWFSPRILESSFNSSN